MATVSAPTSEDIGVLRSSRSGSNSLGDMLRRARELRGLTLERIASETKIPQRHLEAFERDNLAAVPSGFYQRAELRTYAQAVGLDQQLALAKLESALTPADTHDPPETQASKAPASPLPYIVIAVAAIAVTGVLFGRASVEPTVPLAPPVTNQSPAEPSSVAPVVSEPVKSSEPAAAVPTIQVTTEPTQAVAPAPVGSVTELVVTTEPEGARITVNGIGWGSSPARIQYLEPGAKRIRVSKEGYAAVERVVQINEHRRHTLNIQLQSAQ